MYNLGRDLEIKRVADDLLEIKIGKQSTRVHTEDLAAVIRQELPNDRATEMFSEMETEMVTKGKARVVVEAHKDIKKGDPVCFTIDVTRHLDQARYAGHEATGLRVTPGGIII